MRYSCAIAAILFSVFVSPALAIQQLAKTQGMAIGEGDTSRSEALQNGLVAYQNGNYAEAYKQFHIAAMWNDPVAKFNLGTMYLNGVFIQKDYKKAFSEFKKSGSLGYAPAMTMTGVAYREGVGVKTNLLESAVWFEKAAEKGEESAKLNLDEMRKPPPCERGKTGFFGVKLECADRVQIRWMMKKKKIKALDEVNNSYSDSYEATWFHPRAEKVRFLYNRNTLERVEFTIPGSDKDPALVGKIAKFVDEFVESKALNSAPKDEEFGVIGYIWRTKDFFEVFLARNYPDPMIILTFTNPRFKNRTGMSLR